MRAIKDYQEPLKEHEVTIFVRRGGPNYQEGLRVMGEVGKYFCFEFFFGCTIQLSHQPKWVLSQKTNIHKEGNTKPHHQNSRCP